MERPPCTPHLNSKNLWNTLKSSIYQDGWQFSSKVSLWEVNVDNAQSMTRQHIISMTNSMVKRKEGYCM